MSDATTVMQRLDEIAAELDTRSKEANVVERELGGYKDRDGTEVKGVQQLYDDWMDEFEVGLWNASEAGSKLPPEPMRERLGRRAMPPEMLGAQRMLMSKRKRLEKRVSTLRAELSAQQSILGALRSEAEASGAGLRRAT
jgi:predicted  nucleic acid-binding Zn-ribbon protein